jgi:rhodanese-related sulfurtransferase
VVDVRCAPAFGAGHVPGAWSRGLSGQFASWAGTLLDPQREILLVTEDEAGAGEAAVRLSRVGLESIGGHLDGGLAAWHAAGKQVATLPQWPVDELREQIHERGPALQLLDVRRPGEYAAGHVPGARSLPFDRLPREAAALDRSRPLAVVCQSGYRSNVACSLLRQQGFAGELYNVAGGTAAWIAAGFATEHG